MLSEQFIMREMNEDNRNIVKVPFEWFELDKKILSKVAENGERILISTDKILHDGEVVAVEDKIKYVVDVIPCRLIKINIKTIDEMGRISIELLDRKLLTYINENEIRVPFDEDTFSYFKKLGFDAREITEKFLNFRMFTVNYSDL